MTTAIRPQHDRVKVVTRGLYDAQKLRIQLELRVQRLVRDGLMAKDEAETFFQVPLERLRQAETAMERIVWREVRHMPIVDGWLIRVKGVGPRLAALLVANIGDIGRFDTISKLWAYSGLHVVDGRAPKRTKGTKANWNAELKVTAWKLGQSFVKIPDSPYRTLYDAYKVRIVEREVARGNVIYGKPTETSPWTPMHYAPYLHPEPIEVPKEAKKQMKAAKAAGDLRLYEELRRKSAPEWTLGRINNMALRYVAKRLLAHLWLVWRKMEDLPTREPYCVEKMGHTSTDDPWDYVE